jgi:hypothetical protein
MKERRTRSRSNWCLVAILGKWNQRRNCTARDDAPIRQANTIVENRGNSRKIVSFGSGGALSPNQANLRYSFRFMA